ncbi:hypothetical protein BBK36DRAFT_1144489 [Trichoderma citrinoviride]|uniref:Uncharacterized protein n=1 Tax=Trichoderma citrinoviride TaxID=58853 RepID=A0A2T4B0V7_9HYPO|nr:hypothetical protein BBK36DRAFT_1144489 [Trichoderma citrinoviride]PTB62955.1 hypothetical protein BBK36DRAFT_1144489 [Trichoderma citrinoviride]
MPSYHLVSRRVRIGRCKGLASGEHSYWYQIGWHPGAPERDDCELGQKSKKPKMTASGGAQGIGFKRGHRKPRAEEAVDVICLLDRVPLYEVLGTQYSTPPSPRAQLRTAYRNRSWVTRINDPKDEAAPNTGHKGVRRYTGTIMKAMPGWAKWKHDTSMMSRNAAKTKVPLPAAKALPCSSKVA